MQLNRQELKSVAILGAGGLVTAVLYQLGSIYLKQSSDDIKLDPETEVLQTNSDLLHLFNQLAEHRAFNETAYRAAVIAADELMLRLKQVQAGAITPTMDDVHDAFTMYQDTIKQVKKIKAAAEQKGNPRAAAAIDVLLRKLFPEVQQCYIAVQRTLHTA